MTSLDAIDLREIPVVDNHCHGILRSLAFDDLEGWRGAFTESADPAMARAHVSSTAFYRRLIRTLASFFECEPDEETVFAARTNGDQSGMTGALLRSAKIEALLVDTGYPPPEAVVPRDALAELGGCRIEPMLRLETLLERLLSEHETLHEVREALASELDDVRGRGYVGLKSIAAYRTGLAIREWTDEEAEASLREFRRAAERPARLNHKPLLDTLLHVCLSQASRQEVPVQFHCGYGDADTDLLLGNPLQLRAVLQKPGYRGMPVVLLHECYPYTREGGYLAALYENVYLDLSYGIPLLGFDEMLSFTRGAIGVAPTSKLLYSSDGIGVPDLHWMSALDGRSVLGLALAELVARDELSISGAEAAGESVLRGNAIRLYGLPDG